jgi:hypothetical protein
MSVHSVVIEKAKEEAGAGAGAGEAAEIVSITREVVGGEAGAEAEAGAGAGVGVGAGARVQAPGSFFVHAYALYV